MTGDVTFSIMSLNCLYTLTTSMVIMLVVVKSSFSIVFSCRFREASLTGLLESLVAGRFGAFCVTGAVTVVVRSGSFCVTVSVTGALRSGSFCATVSETAAVRSGSFCATGAVTVAVCSGGFCVNAPVTASLTVLTPF